MSRSRSPSPRARRTASGPPAVGISWPRRLAIAALYLLVLVVPLVFVPHATDNFRLPKELASESLVLLSLVLLALGARRFEPRRLWRSPAFQAALPLLLVVGLGLATSEHPGRVMAGLESLLIGVAALCAWSLSLDGKNRRRLLYATLAPAFVLSLVAILQFHQLYEPFEFAGSVTRRFGLTSFAGGAFDLAGYLLLPLLLIQILWRRAAHPAWHAGLALLFLLGLYALLATQTFTVLIALLAGSLVLAVLRPPSRLLALGALLVAVLGAGLAFELGPLASRLELKMAYLDDANQILTGRLDGWRAAWWMFQEHPLTGVGQGAFTTEFAPAKLQLAAAGVPFFLYHSEAHFTSAHNELLEVAAECGLPGILALLWALVVVGRAFSRRAREVADAPAQEADEFVLGVATLVALAILSLFNFPFHLAIIAYPALLLMSGVLAPAAPPPADERRVPSPNRWHLALVAVLALGWVAHYRQATGQLRADRILAEVETATQAAFTQGRLAQQLASRNLHRLQEAARLDDNRIGIHVARAWQYLLRDRTNAAIETLETALEIEPRAEIYVNLGQAHLQAGAREPARQAFRRAVILDPQLARALKSELENLDLRLGDV